MNPDTPDQWVIVARERASDAQLLQICRPESVGSVYLAGYAIECSLKALLQKLCIPFPTSRSAGHNLRNLWRSTGFQISDLNETDGSQTFFLEQWSTDLRYETEIPSLGLTSEQLMQGAKKLSGWLQTEIKRAKRRPRK